jgi:rhamnose utilization protein RhaD (predicted bifunctional aldolase and dehydrogenase)
MCSRRPHCRRHPASSHEAAPILRGACAIADAAAPGIYKRFILDFRGGPAVRNFVSGADVERYGRAGVATPDHTIRTKNYPLIVPAPGADKLDDFAAAAREAVERFVADYHVYFERNNAAVGGIKRELDPMPRVILVPGLGLFGLGRSAKDAAVAADLAESWVATVTDAEAVGTFESLPEAELFEMEYWSLEQAKLGSAVDKPLAGPGRSSDRRCRHDRSRDRARRCATKASRSRFSTAPRPIPKAQRRNSVDWASSAM